MCKGGLSTTNAHIRQPTGVVGRSQPTHHVTAPTHRMTHDLTVPQFIASVRSMHGVGPIARMLYMLIKMPIGRTAQW